MENENLETTTQTPVNFNNQPITLPNSTGILVLGILSIVFCWCYGIIGLTLGIIALVMSKKAIELYNENPANYTEGSYKNMKAGRTCSIIGLSLSAIYGIFIIIYVIILGAALTSMPWDQLGNM